MQRSNGAALPYFQAILEDAAKYGVPPDLALRVANQESGFKQNEVSSAGALGVMQLMPGTAKQLGVNPYDWRQNITGGVRYLSDMLRQFGGNHALAAAAYNAGPGRVQSYLNRGTPLPAETTNYVRSIAGMKTPQAPGLPDGFNYVKTQAVSDPSAAPYQPGTFSDNVPLPPGLLTPSWGGS